MDALKHEQREKIEKEGGVMHSFSPEERMSFSQLISFNHRGDPDLADVLPIDPESMELFNAVGNGILLCKMINHAVPGTIESKLINIKKPLNVFQIKENLSQAIKGATQIGCVIVSITPPLIMEKREHIILGMIWQVLKATLGLQVNIKKQPNMIRLKKEAEDLNTFQNLPTEEMLLRWLNYHLRNAGSDRVAKNFSGDLKDAQIYSIVLNQLEPKTCDLSGLNMNDSDRATKVIEDTVKLQIPRFLRPEDILAGNPKLNLIFCGEIFNHYPGLVGMQPFTEADRMAFASLISANYKDEEVLQSKLPINPNSKDLLKVSRDGQLLTKMMNRAVKESVDEGKTQWGDNNDKQMIQNLDNFLEGALKQGLPLDFIKATMIIDELEDLTLATLWEVLKKTADEEINPAKQSNLIRLKKSEEDLEDFKKIKGAEHFLLRWINYHLQNAGSFKEVQNFKDHLKDGMVYTVLLNQLDDAQCDKSGLEDPEDVRIQKAIDNAAKLGVPRFIRPTDVLGENDRLNLLFCAEIYYRQSGLRAVEPYSDADRIALAILLSERHKGDEHLQKYLPINPQSKDLFSTTANSVLLAKMVQKADPNVLDIGQINTGENLEVGQVEDNLQKSLNAANKLGCDLKNIGVPTIVSQVPDLVLKTLFEILKADLKNHLNTDNVPLLSELKRADEDLEAFKKINCPEHYLLRWINHHLKNAGSDKEVKNFGSDLKDGTAYTLLLNQLEPIQCDKSGLDKSEEERAGKVINDAASLGVPKFLSPADIVGENKDLNLLFCAEIFNRNNGLEPAKEFNKEEKRCYARIINQKLKDDADVADVVPINPDTNALFSSLKDGIILNKLVNDSVAGTIDPRAINVKKPLTPFQVKENLQLGLASAKSVGCKIDEITPHDIVKGKESEDLKLLGEVLKAKPHWNVNLKDHPHLLRLKGNEEELGDLLKLSPEDWLLRWINHHLKNAGNEQGIKNFGDDLKDCKNWTLLLNQLDPAVDKSGLDEDEKSRASKVVENSKALGVTPFMEAEDLLAGNPNLNYLFAYDLFLNKPNIQVTEQEKFEAAGLLKDDVGDSREERSFRMWVNSLKIPDVHVNNLFEDIKDGIVLLKVLDRVEPGCVDWKKVEHKPNMRLKKISNANIAIEIGKNMKFSLVNVGGIDLVDGKKKLALALIWQMVRKHTLKLLGGWTEEKLLEWALERVHKDPKITSFKDKSLANCHFLFNLLASIEPRVINWDLVTPGNTPEDIENNCNYVLSVARKLGAVIFLVWEDIKDVNPKMIMTLFAALVNIVKYGQQEEMIDFTKKTATDL